MPSSPVAPLDALEQWLPPEVISVVERETPIPTIAQLAGAKAMEDPGLVRGDIGQIVGIDPELEVLYGPPVGLPDLRAAVADMYQRALGWTHDDTPLTAANVTICTGAAEALTLLFKCFAKDRTVGLLRGHWENYRNGVDLAGGRTVIVDVFDEAGNFTPDGLEAQIREHDVRVLVANFPCNPTGAVLDAHEMAQLAQVAERTGIIVMADEVYARLRYDGKPPETLVRYAPGHAISLSSASKEYLLPGARVGYVVSARSEVTDRVLRKLVRANTASPNVLGQKRLLSCLNADLADMRAGRPPALITRIRDEMAKRRTRLVEILERHDMSLVGRSGHAPVGTIFLMAALPSWFPRDDTAFSEEAIAAGAVSTIPGSAFGIPSSVRFSYGAMTLEALERLDSNLTAFKASFAS